MTTEPTKISLERPIYLDYAATTPVDPRVLDAMVTYLGPDGHFGNPASRSHAYGWAAEAAVDESRDAVATLIGADPREIVWTSGATEANNLAIKGVASMYASRGRHIVSSAIEHKAVLDPLRELEKDGYEVTLVSPRSDGMIDPADVAAAVRDDTILLSFMMVNNEIGTITDIAALAEIAHAHKALLHVDAAQGAARLPIDVNAANVDLLSLSGHKMYGPKGIGALYVRRRPRVRLSAQMHGGGHERGMRSGTLAPHQIVGMGEAARLVMQQREQDVAHQAKLRSILRDKLSHIEAMVVNGNYDHAVPGITNLSFNYVEGEGLMMAMRSVAVSSGSACTSASLEPSYVLRALGLPDELAHSSLRMSTGRFTTEEDIRKAVTDIEIAVTRLRALSPLWEMYKDGVDLSQVQWTEH